MEYYKVTSGDDNSVSYHTSAGLMRFIYACLDVKVSFAVTNITKEEFNEKTGR